MIKINTLIIIVTFFRKLYYEQIGNSNHQKGSKSNTSGSKF